MSELDFSHLSESELRDKLIAAGAAVGPITSTTRKLFEKKLKRLLQPEEDSEENSVVFNSKREEKHETKEKSPSPVNIEPATYFGVALPPEKCDPEKAHECVFGDGKEALKFAKSETGARFKEFPTREEAVAFASTPAILQPTYMPPTKAPAGESSPFKGPKVPELSKFKMMIEKGQLVEMYDTIWGNPRYMISSGDSPVILQVGCRYNALHICALKNKPEAAQLVLDTLEDPAFMARLYPEDSEEARDNRIRHILDLYLNMPDKGNCEAPLHFACKFGNVEMVSFLVNCKYINLELLNLHGETPKQIVCSRAPKKDNKQEILQILEATYYVPLMRPADKSCIARVGNPWSPANGQEPCLDIDSNRNNNNGDPTMSPLVLHAYAGPMSPSQARAFRKRWMQHTSHKDRLKFLSICCKDDEKGLERIGRMLAQEQGVRWSEYWEFLEDYIDVSTAEGLQVLEDYLEQIKLDVSLNISHCSPPIFPTHTPHQPPDSPTTDPDDDSFMALLGSEFAKLRIKSPSPDKKTPDDIGTVQRLDLNEGSEENMEDKMDVSELPQFSQNGESSYRKTIPEDVGVHTQVMESVHEGRPKMMNRSERGSGDTEYESCESDSDESVNTYYTATDSIGVHPPPYDMSSPLPNTVPPIFLLGLEPCKFDTDVLHALGDKPIAADYPNLVRWRNHVTAFKEEDRNRWTSPRRDNRSSVSLGTPHRERSLSGCSHTSRSPYLTPQRLTSRLTPKHTPTLLHKDPVRTNLHTQLMF